MQIRVVVANLVVFLFSFHSSSKKIGWLTSKASQDSKSESMIGKNGLRFTFFCISQLFFSVSGLIYKK